MNVFILPTIIAVTMCAVMAYLIGALFYEDWQQREQERLAKMARDWRSK